MESYQVRKNPFVWDYFKAGAEERNGILPDKAEQNNRLLAETENFYVIPAKGSFRPGQLVIIPKYPTGAIAYIEDKHINEFNWLKEKMTQVVSEVYDSRVIEFEHGMCGCIGVDQAHYMLAPVSKNITEDDIAQALDKVLVRRAVGFKSVTYRDFEFTNPHDIKQLIEDENPENIIVKGKQTESQDLVGFNGDYFSQSRKLLDEGEHYTFFKGISSKSSFLRGLDLGSQFCREVIYEADVKHSRVLQQLASESPPWNWKEYPHWDNMTQTMHDLAPALSRIQGAYGYKTAVKLNNKDYRPQQGKENWTSRIDSTTGKDGNTPYR